MKEKEIKKKRLALLNRVAERYNSNNRSVVHSSNSGLGGVCCYIKPDGNRCAIGWELPEAVCRILDKKNNPINALNPQELALIPVELKSLGFEFLKRVQDLHDTAKNWNKSGLSDEGNAFYRGIVNAYCI